MSIHDWLRNRVTPPPPKPSPFEGEGFSLVLDDGFLRITHLGGIDQPNLFICFTGVLQAMGGIGAEEFVGSTRLPGYSALFISDLKRSWFNAFESARLFDAIARYTAGKRIISVGNSMGGFGAIWASRYLPIDTVIAFAPQFSVHPEIMPAEKRWMEFRAAIGTWRAPSLADCFVPGTRYYTFNGDEDGQHHSRFPVGPQIRHYLIPNSGHEPAARLKEQGVLSEVIAICSERGDPSGAIHNAGIELQGLGGRQ